MKVLFRPNLKNLDAAMKEMEVFNSVEEMISTLVERFNAKYGHIFKVETSDIELEDYEDDIRVGWENLWIICIKKYDEVSDSKGYLRWFKHKYVCNQVFFGYCCIREND